MQNRYELEQPLFDHKKDSMLEFDSFDHSASNKHMQLEHFRGEWYKGNQVRGNVAGDSIVQDRSFE